MGSLQKITRLLCKITQIYCVRLVRYAKPINWSFTHARNARRNRAEKQYSFALAACLPMRMVNDHCVLLVWRNRQTRTAQDRMGKPVEVRVLSRAIASKRVSDRIGWLTCLHRLSFSLPSALSSAGKAFFCRQVSVRAFSSPERPFCRP